MHGSREGDYVVRTGDDAGDIIEIVESNGHPDACLRAAEGRAALWSEEYGTVRLELVVRDDDDETATELVATFTDGLEDDL